MTDIRTDQVFMSRALSIARTAGPEVSPNPTVGAVLCAGRRIIGEGVTAADGGPHAEVQAIRSVGDADRELIAGATLYVTLEPCSIHGRTPPCCDLIVRERIGRVVVGCIDFTRGVCGAGLERLREGDVEVTVGTLQAEAFALSAARRTFVRHRRPYVILKQAIAPGGFVGYVGAPGAITSRAANVISHTWRAAVDAILVGAGTVRDDDPELTVRHVAAPNHPARIVLDPSATVSPSSRVFSGAAPSIWAIDANTLLPEGLPAGVEVLPLEPTARLHSLLTALHGQRIGRLLVEGGPRTLAGFFAKGAWDEYREWRGVEPLATNRALVEACPAAGRLVDTRAVGGDELRLYENQTACPER